MVRTRATNESSELHKRNDSCCIGSKWAGCFWATRKQEQTDANSSILKVGEEENFPHPDFQKRAVIRQCSGNYAAWSNFRMIASHLNTVILRNIKGMRKYVMNHVWIMNPLSELTWYTVHRAFGVESCAFPGRSAFTIVVNGGVDERKN